MGVDGRSSCRVRSCILDQFIIFRDDDEYVGGQVESLNLIYFICSIQLLPLRLVAKMHDAQVSSTSICVFGSFLSRRCTYLNAACVNANGSTACGCADGWMLANATAGHEVCVNVNECNVSAATACPSSGSTCVDTVGSYECQCSSGFTVFGRCVMALTDPMPLYLWMSSDMVLLPLPAPMLMFSPY